MGSENPSGDPRPCEYCGTTIAVDDDGIKYELATEVRHYTSSCIEYVHAALRATKRENARLRAALETLREIALAGHWHIHSDERGFAYGEICDAIRLPLWPEAPESKGDQ